MKKQHKQQQPKKAQVHIRLENPVSTRKEILTYALNTAKLLKDADELSIIREKKIKTIRKLSRVLKEIKILEKQLSEIRLPHLSGQAGIEFPHHLHHAIKEMAIEARKVPKKTGKEKTEADKLKDELYEIEEKLKSL